MNEDWQSISRVSLSLPCNIVLIYSTQLCARERGGGKRPKRQIRTLQTVPAYRVCRNAMSLKLPRPALLTRVPSRLLRNARNSERMEINLDSCFDRIQAPACIDRGTARS
jgi:hypothetical protein